MKLSPQQVQQAKAFPVVDYLAKYGCKPAIRYGNQLVYKSPFSNEKTPSFFVHPEKNVFKCFSSGKSGDVINLVQELEGVTFLDACLQLISDNFKPSFSFSSQFINMTEKVPETPVKINAVKELNNRALLDYLESRKIDIEIARKYCKELYYYSKQGKHYFAVAFENNEGGFELRNKFQKNSISPKTYTHIRNLKESSYIRVFEGFFDYLSFLTYWGGKDILYSDYLILNSLSFIVPAISVLSEYSNVYLYLNNDRRGKEATETLLELNTQYTIEKFHDCSIAYAGYNDYNDYIRGLKMG